MLPMISLVLSHVAELHKYWLLPCECPLLLPDEQEMSLTLGCCLRYAEQIISHCSDLSTPEATDGTKVLYMRW